MKALDAGIHGLLRRSELKRSWVSSTGDGEVGGRIFPKEKADVLRYDNRVFDTGRMTYLRAPKPIFNYQRSDGFCWMLKNVYLRKQKTEAKMKANKTTSTLVNVASKIQIATTFIKRKYLGMVFLSQNQIQTYYCFYLVPL